MKRITVIGLFLLFACRPEHTAEDRHSMVRLITLDPGHFHAALVQKSMYPGVDSVVHVYALPGQDLSMHLERIESYNSRGQEPTRWMEEVYAGEDFFEKMIREKAGNVVVLAGNNRSKTEFIARSISAGFNVLGDKPMAIDKKGFEILKAAFDMASKKEVLLYDIMTERSEITTRLQREFSQMPEVFGTLENGSPENPAVTKESVHYFYKYVSGKVLKRPPWFMDVEQAGEGIVDVTTHLVDLVQWECFPEQAIDYTKDIRITSARRWATEMKLSQFKTITQLDAFPVYLKKDVVQDSVLKIYCNGEINYTLKGVSAKVSVRWNFKAPEGAGDTHYSTLRGTKSDLIIRQGEDQHFVPTLYIEPKGELSSISDAFEKVEAKFQGIELKKNGKGWEVEIPDRYRDGHEAHFARVMERYLDYLKNKSMPSWEVPNMLAKYYTTTTAREMALENQK